MSAAANGDDFAYQILGANIDHNDPVWAEISHAWATTRPTDNPRTFFCYRPGSGVLNLTGH